MVCQNLGGNDKWSTWVGWQYTSTGRVSGISGNVDRDRYAENIFLKDTSNIPEEKTKKKVKNTREVDYVVKRGDTLYDVIIKEDAIVEMLDDYNKMFNQAFTIPTYQKYKKDVQKAYECCNRAVSLDKKFLAERAGFRNFVLNDKQGALEDYNAALAVETDPQRLAMISYCINQINSGQNFGGLGCGLKLILFLVVILVISAIVYIVFLR